jgi:hypothetical protein
MAEAVGWDNGAWEYVEEKRIAVSALRRLKEQDNAWRASFVRGFNRVLGAMGKAPGWKPLTIYVFKNRKASAAFEAFIKRTLASMSVCRNSLVIPHLTGKFNISFLCAGGVSWGDNYPFHLTSGWPWPLWQELNRRATVRG